MLALNSNPERVTNPVRRNIKFKDRVQVLEFKEKQFVSNLLKGAKKDIPLHEGESEYTKKDAKKKTMKKSGTRRVPKEHVGIVLARQKEIEAHFGRRGTRTENVFNNIENLFLPLIYE